MKRERRGRMRCVGGERERRRLRVMASSRGRLGQSGGVGGSWWASCGAVRYWRGGSPPRSMDLPRRGAAAVAAVGTGRVTVLGGGGPGGPLWRGYGGRADTVLGTEGGGPWLSAGELGWSTRGVVLPSHALVPLVHGGLWPGWVGLWAVVVVVVVVLVVVVGALVAVALVVVVIVVQVWP